MSQRDIPSVEAFAEGSRRWLASQVPLRSEAAIHWGDGSDSVAVFHNMTPEAELHTLTELRAWHQLKCDAGFAAITIPRRYGGQGLTQAHQQEFSRIEQEYDTPSSHELFRITVNLIAPTVLQFGNEYQLESLLRPLVRAEEFCCQLFSEPAAGSDLASLGLKAIRDGDEWVLTGQKVWTSGARFAQWGEVLARSDSDQPKHKGITAFLVPLDAPGVEIRPIRQMSGGTSFNEVFFTEVRVQDHLRIGAEGQGWEVGLTTLGFERSTSGAKSIGGSWEQVLALARKSGRVMDPLVRQQLAEIYLHGRIREMTALRVAAAQEAGKPPGPEGSVQKLSWTRQLDRISAVASSLLGPSLIADSGEWGTYAWSEHVLGAPGFHIAGGSDEIQRNIAGERSLGLPPDPRSDRGLSWSETRRG